MSGACAYRGATSMLNSHRPLPPSVPPPPFFPLLPPSSSYLHSCAIILQLSSFVLPLPVPPFFRGPFQCCQRVLSRLQDMQTVDCAGIDLRIDFPEDYPWKPPKACLVQFRFDATRNSESTSWWL